MSADTARARARNDLHLIGTDQSQREVLVSDPERTFRTVSLQKVNLRDRQHWKPSARVVGCRCHAATHSALSAAGDGAGGE